MIAEQLKKSILLAAIQGKLTEQLPADGDVRDFFSKYDKKKPVPEVFDDEVPFDIPENWCWVRHSDLAELSGGSQPPKSFFSDVYVEGYVRLFQTRDYGSFPVPVYIPQHFATKTTKEGDILLARYGGSLGKVFFAKDGAYNVALAKVTYNEKILNKYYLYYFYCGDIYQFFVSQASRSAQPGFNKEDFKKLLIPVPPIDEQERIVKRLNEILPEIDKLKNDENKLGALQKSFPNKMKDSILQYAVQGKLTEQIPEDGNARDLLRDIHKEKILMIKEGKIKKEIPLPEVSEDEIPFDIPDSWHWVRLVDLCEYLQRGKSPKYSQIKKYPVIAQKCNQWDGFSIEKAQFIDPDTINKYGEERKLIDDDLMWNSTGLGTLGRMAIYSESKNPYGFAVADSHVTVIRTLRKYINPRYIFAYISGPYIQSIVEDISSGSTNQIELATKTIKNLIIPLPPYPEQNRIVERLKEFIPLCESLE